jgi:uncharacterized protein YneF (UPF0154 family)
MVTLLLAVVAIAARGRPLGSGGGGHGGLPLSFWDYVFTTVVILVVPLFVAGLFMAAFIRRQQSGKKPNYWQSMLRLLVFYSVVLGLELLVVRHLHLPRHLQLHKGQETVTDLLKPGQNQGRHHPHAASRSPHFRWDELAVILGLLLAVAAGVFIAVMRARREPRTRPETAEALAAALDESLDDLRTDPDVRRAIIAAYARMETALAAAGIPRHPAEAPLEYVERALLSLHTSAEAVRRLTELFEWARFSHHEPEPSMKDDAVDALVAVRDELRASELVPA